MKTKPTAEQADLPADQSAWVPVARAILAGKYDGADGSTRKSLKIGLELIEEPTCKAALARIAKRESP